MRVGRIARRELHRGVCGVACVGRVRVCLGVHRWRRTVGRGLVVAGLLGCGCQRAADVSKEQMRLTGGEGEATCSEDAEGAGELCRVAIGGGDG